MARSREAPDGGYGWVVAAASFCLQGISVGLAFSVGVYYPEFLAAFQQDKATTAWVGSINTGLLFAAGPLASVLTNVLGHRTVCMLGSLLASLGLFASAFASNLYVLFFTYSIVAGCGFCLIYIPSVVIVGEYFTSKRAIAMPLAVSGVGVFCLLFPPILRLCVAHYSWRGTLIISAGFCLQAAVFGALLRPLKPRTISCDGLFGFKLLRNMPFWLLFMNNVLWNMGSLILIILVVDYAYECGIDKFRGSWMLSAVGITGTLGRVTTAACGNVFNHLHLFIITTSLSGVAICFIPLAKTFMGFLCLCSLYGFNFGVQLGVLGVLTANLFGLEQLTSAFGYLMVSNGLGALLGPPIAGELYMVTESYDVAFYFGGIVTIIAGIIMCLVIPFRKRDLKSDIVIESTLEHSYSEVKCPA